MASTKQPGRNTQLLGDMYKRHPRPQAAALPPRLPINTVAAYDNSTLSNTSEQPSATGGDALQQGHQEVQREKKIDAGKAPTSDGTSRDRYDTTKLTVHKASPWTHGLKLGNLTQGSTVWSIRSPKEPFCDIIMFKKTNEEKGKLELDILDKLSHPNIMKLRHTYAHDGATYLGFEYCRHTLEELIHVHLELQEPQIKVIAQSVFSAIAELSKAGLAHNQISLQSIRISNRKPQILLADFQHCTRTANPTNTDLEALAVVLVECMDGRPHGPTDTVVEKIARARAQRKENQVFGVKNAERWSGCKQLIDFLDELLSVGKSPSSKFQKPHDYVAEAGTQRATHPGVLQAFTELVPLECYSQWMPAFVVS